MPKRRTREDDKDDSWMEVGNQSALTVTGRAPGKQVADAPLVSKERMRAILGISKGALENLLKEGAPVVVRGSAKTDWKINTAEFLNWYVQRCIDNAPNRADEEATDAFTVAKTREKEAQGKLRELEIAKQMGKLVPIDDVVLFESAVAAKVRSQLDAIPSQMTRLDPDQREELEEALRSTLDALASFKPEIVFPEDDVADETDSDNAEDDSES